VVQCVGHALIADPLLRELGDDALPCIQRAITRVRRLKLPGGQPPCGFQCIPPTHTDFMKLTSCDSSVFYQRVPRLFAALALARGDGSYAKLLRQLARVDLLILDDWDPEPLIAEQQRDLLEIVEDRYSAGSLIITSQVPIDRWYEIVGNPTLADAILDRFIHNAHRIELKGESLRKQRVAT
jgi:hypothetical protein